MASYRIKAAGEHSHVLESVMNRVYDIASKKDDKDVLILVSQLQNAKNNKKIEQILGSTMYESLVKRKDRVVGIADVNVEFHPYAYISNSPYRGNNKTLVVLNPSISDLETKFSKLHKTTDLIVVEMHSDGELDKWVDDNQAKEL
ncbi:TPA: hypothetical protein ACYSC8_005156 [Citrobacter freundii]|uniref:Uncharacterized protein n=3 Tax=Citrobacter freundii TaxID=546 RepID=A0AAI9HGT3_CITFR|nr:MULTISPECIES: hypothetical protein [Citrobacter]EKU4728651.1 hypothetical protein [Citrobacter freundii]EKV2291865.1 hypothetical protein [Citrobacter freundii]EKV7199673.1 hypothetical protein [Citrobacter freundii]EKW4403964.1 hypothetical protein [Citrobacter freundii]EKX8779129.1 hypothetical protein [Citrobacter freundii]